MSELLSAWNLVIMSAMITTGYYSPGTQRKFVAGAWFAITLLYIAAAVIKTIANFLS